MHIPATLTTLLTLLSLTTAAPTASQETTSKLVARTSGSFTYYNTGLGACGWWNGDNEYVVALNKEQFDPSTPNGNPNNNSLCGRRVRIYYNGRSVDATVVDRCPSCGWGGLDLSPTAFGALADLGVGRIQGDWDWI